MSWKTPPQVGVPVHVAGRPAPVRGVDDPDRIEVGVELLGDDRRQPRVDSLPHLDLARVGDDRPVLADPDVRMDRVARVLRREAPELGLQPGPTSGRGFVPAAHHEAASWMAARIRG